MYLKIMVFILLSIQLLGFSITFCMDAMCLVLFCR